MHVEAVRPGDPNRLAIVSNGCCTVKFRRCEDTGLAEVTLTGTCTADPGREELDLVQGVEFRYFRPITCTNALQGGVFGDTLSSSSRTTRVVQHSLSTKRSRRTSSRSALAK
jgi:hypothetical protein